MIKEKNHAVIFKLRYHLGTGYEHFKKGKGCSCAYLLKHYTMKMYGGEDV
jgi:hypothetical protein